MLEIRFPNPRGMRIWNSLLPGPKSLTSFKRKLDVFGKIIPNGDGICLIAQEILSALTFLFSALPFGCSMKKSQKVRRSYVHFGMSSPYNYSAVCVHLSGGAETRPYPSSELLSVKLSKNKSSTSEKKLLVSLHAVFCPQRKEARNVLPW